MSIQYFLLFSAIAAKGTMNMRGMTPQMLASQQMLAVLNQQGLSVSGVKGLNSMMLGNNMAAKSGSVTIQVSQTFILISFSVAAIITWIVSTYLRPYLSVILGLF